jgi:superfamily II DNA or RNA helicase
MLNSRSYQEEVIRAVLDAYARGTSFPLVAPPTKTGKTIIFANLIRQREGRALVLAYQDELMRWAEEKIRMVVDPKVELKDAQKVGIAIPTLRRTKAALKAKSVKCGDEWA